MVYIENAGEIYEEIYDEYLEETTEFVYYDAGKYIFVAN